MESKDNKEVNENGQGLYSCALDDVEHLIPKIELIPTFSKLNMWSVMTWSGDGEKQVVIYGVN